MKKTLNTHQIAEELLQDDYAGWSRQGAFALANYLEEYEEDTGEELELDIVAIRCEFTEWKSIDEFLNNYTDFDNEDIRDEDGEIDEDELEAEIESATQLIKISSNLFDGFITQDF